MKGGALNMGLVGFSQWCHHVEAFAIQGDFIRGKAGVMAMHAAFYPICLSLQNTLSR